jgi:hypothetical protein
MSEVLIQFDTTVADGEAGTYVARVCGRLAEDGLWEGWIEFDPQDGGPVLRTPRETEQHDRGELEYWATGLSVAYLEGALERARDAAQPDVRPRTVDVEPAYDRPAPHSPPPSSDPPVRQVRPRAILDPFQVYGQGENVLREELGALDEDHLRNILRAYDLAGDDSPVLRAAERAALAETIVAAVRRRAG